MTFHQEQAFRDAIEAAAAYHQLQPIFIEKDYWVTYILKNIALSAYSKQVVFKGGTSLSKAYQCIERFSEDVDLLQLTKTKCLNYYGESCRLHLLFKIRSKKYATS